MRFSKFFSLMVLILLLSVSVDQTYSQIMPAPLSFPFNSASGEWKITSGGGYNNGAYHGTFTPYAQYALDLERKDGSTEGQFIHAPTNVFYVRQQGTPDCVDFAIAEYSSTHWLWLEMCHIDLESYIPQRVYQPNIVVKGQVIGRISSNICGPAGRCPIPHIHMAAHELRAPMTAIKGYLSMIKDGDAGQISPRAMEFLGDAMSGNDRLIRLVNNMLNISRIEEGRMVFDIGIVDMNTVVETVFNDYQIDAKNKGLDYRFESDALSQFPVKVDKDRIHEVIGNLISNAIKYTDRGIVLVKVFKPSFDKVRIEVSDTGPGASPEEQQKLFQKFYRAESTIGKQLGTGLGLYVSKLLVEKFGGRIGFQSELGKGTTFWFELPISKA